jgi:hypothetical protein
MTVVSQLAPAVRSVVPVRNASVDPSAVLVQNAPVDPSAVLVRNAAPVPSVEVARNVMVLNEVRAVTRTEVGDRRVVADQSVEVDRSVVVLNVVQVVSPSAEVQSVVVLNGAQVVTPSAEDPGAAAQSAVGRKSVARIGFQFLVVLVHASRHLRALWVLRFAPDDPEVVHQAEARAV